MERYGSACPRSQTSVQGQSVRRLATTWTGSQRILRGETSRHFRRLSCRTPTCSCCVAAQCWRYRHRSNSLPRRPGWSPPRFRGCRTLHAALEASRPWGPALRWRINWRAAGVRNYRRDLAQAPCGARCRHLDRGRVHQLRRERRVLGQPSQADTAEVAVRDSAPGPDHAAANTRVLPTLPTRCFRRTHLELRALRPHRSRPRRAEREWRGWARRLVGETLHGPHPGRDVPTAWRRAWLRPQGCRLHRPRWYSERRYGRLPAPGCGAPPLVQGGLASLRSPLGRTSTRSRDGCALCPVSHSDGHRSPTGLLWERCYPGRLTT